MTPRVLTLTVLATRGMYLHSHCSKLLLLHTRSGSSVFKVMEGHRAVEHTSKREILFCWCDASRPGSRRGRRCRAGVLNEVEHHLTCGRTDRYRQGGGMAMDLATSGAGERRQARQR